MSSRPDRDSVLMDVAKLFAERGTCKRAKVGAVLSRDGRIISTGYVGAPRGLPHCLDVGCLLSEYSGCLRTVHAEANAIAFAAKYGVATDNTELHCTHGPCGNCAKLLINAGVKRIVYLNDYRDTTPLIMLSEAEIEVVHAS